MSGILFSLFLTLPRSCDSLCLQVVNNSGFWLRLASAGLSIILNLMHIRSDNIVRHGKLCVHFDVVRIVRNIHV